MQPTNISAFFDVLGKSQKVYSRHLEPVSRKWDLTRSELDVMLFLYNNPEYNRAADIVAHRGMAKSHVSLSVTSLADRGLLLRQFSAEDRRTAHLSLTEDGLVIAREAREAQQRFFEAIYSGLPREDLLLLRKITQKVIENMDNLEKAELNF